MLSLRLGARGGIIAAVDEVVFQKLVRFEEGIEGQGYRWLGRPVGLALGLGMLLATTALTPVAWGIMLAPDGSQLVAKLVGGVWIFTIAVTLTYWRRQRLAAHFEAAHRRLGGAAPDRQRALVDLIVNSRRGRAEHARIARALAAYLRAAPADQPAESERRQLAFGILADQTLTMRAKERLDLSGAVLTGIRGVNAELPGVCLRGADLRGARLTRANLEGADLRDARLDGCDLTGAHLARALLPGVATPAPPPGA